MKIPEKVAAAWEKRKGPVVLTTVNPNGVPNSIWATCTQRHGDEYVVVADNFFHKTKQNIKDGSHGAVLFITDEGASFQFKGTLEYHTDGPIFDAMKEWNPENLPGHAAAALVIEEVYSGADKLE